jgi:Interferon-induced transmembrane protein
MSYTPPTSRDYVPNNLVWAILSTLFCCMPLGIVSIVYAARVDGKRAAGDIAGAREDARLAANWAIASAIGFPILILILTALGALGSLAGAD